MTTEQTYTLHVSDDFGFTFNEICKFDKSNKPYKEPICTLGTRVKILNDAGEEVDSYNLLPINKAYKFKAVSDEKFALVN